MKFVSRVLLVAGLATLLHWLWPAVTDHTEDLEQGRMKRKGKAQIVIGILVKSDITQTILTLNSVILSMNATEKSMCIIVVGIPFSLRDKYAIERKIVHEFSAEVKSGLLEVIFSVNTRMNPEMMEQNNSLSSDNHYISYLMFYCQSHGHYYLQLDDSVIAAERFVTSITNFISQIQHNYWISLGFTRTGFIGALFKTSELQLLSQVFSMASANDNPDKVLQMYIDVKHKQCVVDKNNPVQNHCYQEMGLSRILHRPSLFLLKTTDENSIAHKVMSNIPLTYEAWPWDNVPIYINPPAKLASTLRHYRNHSLERAYHYQDYFYAIQPQAGDFIYFNFTPPVVLEEFFIQCGNKKHPWYMFEQSTYVDILPLLPNKVNLTYNYFFNYKFLDDGYIKITRFDYRGRAQGPLGDRFGRIVSVRIRITERHQKWIPVRHFSFKLQMVSSSKKPCCEPYWPDPFPGGIPGVKRILD